MDAFSLVINDDSSRVADGIVDEISERKLSRIKLQEETINCSGTKDDDSRLVTKKVEFDVEDGHADEKHSLDPSMMDSNVLYNQLFEKIQMVEELEQRLLEAEKNIGISALSGLVPWRYSSGPAQLTTSYSMKSKTFKLPLDMGSVLAAWEWNTKPFWASVLVFSFQFILLFVLIWDLMEGGTVGNLLNVPANVEISVRVAQAVAVPVAVFSQEDLRDGIHGLFQGMPHAFRGDIKFQSMTSSKWRWGYFARFVIGFLSMCASFILLIQAETVFDLLLNFLGVEFISDLDDLAFRLAGFGYFGITTRECVKTISEAQFSKDEKIATARVKFSRSWWRKYAHILGVFFIFIAIYTLFIIYASLQVDGRYLPSTIQVEFGDGILSHLGIFNGCYVARRDRSDGLVAERFAFEQMGRSSLQGKFAYCSDRLEEGAWVFFHDEDGDDPCENPIISSGITKTFDVRETVESRWYTTQAGLPLDYLQIYAINEESCGSLKLLDETRDSCLEIQFDLDGRSSTFQKRQLSDSSEGKIFDAIRSHPIYVGANGSESEVVFFTGRRWVLANSSKIGSLENTTMLLDDDGNSEFYEALMNVTSEWILSISEPVDAANDQGTPLGLQWYFPRNVGKEDDSMASFNFHTTDLTRPVGLTCSSCNSKTNPCLYEGVCSDDIGTCECKHGASGKLCRERPSGDGICNAYFNTQEFGYDSGDCCASTCGASACDNSSIAFPYGLDVLDKRENESRAVWFDTVVQRSGTFFARGYDECKDPDQAAFTIEIKPSVWFLQNDTEQLVSTETLLGFDSDFDWDTSSFCTIDSVQLRCDDNPYMEIPSIVVATVEHIAECPTYRQTFQVPYGASCEISFTNDMPTILQLEEIPQSVKLFYGSGGEPIYEKVLSSEGAQTFGWEVPVSK